MSYNSSKISHQYEGILLPYHKDYPVYKLKKALVY